jgi:hypothetical protein
LDESDAVAGRRSVSVYSPGGAFWTVALHARSTDPEELVATVLKAVKQEYEEFESEPVQEEVAGKLLAGYDLNFYCLDLTNSALIRGFRTDAASCVILCQAEDREFREVEPVFRAITASLLRDTDL